MNPLTNVKNIKKLSEEELKGKSRISWHEQYRCSAWIFVGGLAYDLTEGDIICVFSQFGEPVNINLVRDKETGKSKGFCFICYEDQRSTDLAVDNLNGVKILGRTIRVDHVENYKPPKSSKDEQSDKTSKAKKEKLKKEKVICEDDSLVLTAEDGDLINKQKKKEKHRREGELDSSEYRKKKKDAKVEKKGRRNLEFSGKINDEKKRKKRKQKSSGSESSSSSSSSKSSTSSLSSVSSPLSSSSSSSDNNQGSSKTKNRKAKSEKCQRRKRNRTIEDLKREARLIQAELKRRQQIEEQTKKWGRNIDEKQQSKKKGKRSRSRSIEKEKKRCNSKDTQRKVEKRYEKMESSKDQRKRNRSGRSKSRDRQRSKTPERYRENGHRHRLQ